MKKTFYLLLTLILITFVATTSYTPKAAQAEMITQENSVMYIEDTSHTENEEDSVAENSIMFSNLESADFMGEDPKLDTDNQINANNWGYYSLVGSDFMPDSSNLRYSIDSRGCLDAVYNPGLDYVKFYAPINVPYNAKGYTLQFIYYFSITYENPWEFSCFDFHLYRKFYNSNEKELVQSFDECNAYEGVYSREYSLDNLTFNTSHYSYWVEANLTSVSDLCGLKIEYSIPSFYPIALPMISTQK